jgi:hypothetical protein
MAFINAKDHFNTKIWNGNSSTQAITGVGFQPDIVWGKQRTGTQAHQVLDVIRGANNILVSNTTAAAVADSNILNSFDSDGFTLGNQDQLNDTGATYVGWSWKVGGAGSANTDGSINTTSTSVNTTAGVSISTYTGTGAAATIGHGLGVAPEVVICKELGAATAWTNYHQAIGNTKYVHLCESVAEDTSDIYFNNTTPTSSVFSVKTGGGTNRSGGNFVAYCFAPKTGFSAFGKYIGNGNVDGPMVITGFKPSLVIFKKTNDVGDWQIVDDQRDGYNPDNDYLQANTNLAEQTTDIIDLVSNGFKIRGDNSNGWNKGSSTYLYMAFAKAPLVGSNNIPATAR